MVPRREQLVRDTFVDLADTLAADYDIGELLHMLVERCEMILKADTGGVTLEDSDGALRVAAATSEQMRSLEDAELEFDEGPCLDAYRHVSQVMAEDLRKEDERWPHVAAHAVDQGLLAVVAFPLRLRGDCIGAMNLYREDPGGFDDDDVRLGQAFADVAAIGILQERKVTDSQRRADQLQTALNSRIIIEQAKGTVHERYGVDPEEAFRLLRRQARRSNRKLHDVCRDVIDGEAISDLT